MGSHVRGNARGRARSRIGRTLIAKRPEYAAACTFSITFLRHHAPSMLGSLPLRFTLASTRLFRRDHLSPAKKICSRRGDFLCISFFLPPFTASSRLRGEGDQSDPSSGKTAGALALLGQGGPGRAMGHLRIRHRTLLAGLAAAAAAACAAASGHPAAPGRRSLEFGEPRARGGHAARRLAEAERDGPAGDCRWLDTLPGDLSGQDEGVGIERYGEKQNSVDGSLDLHGMGFRVPAPGPRGERLLSTSLTVLVPSVLKIKCAAAEPDVTCTVRVAIEDEDAAEGEARLQHVDGADSGTVLLPIVRPSRGGSRQRHVIRLSFTVPQDKAGSCFAFEFMLQMRPVAGVSDEIRCPPTLPAATLPPRKLSVDAEGVHFASDQLLITPDKLQEHSTRDGAFVYPMSIRVKHRPVTLAAQVSFDWILGDMHLELVRTSTDDLAGSSGKILYKSNETDAEDEESQFERTSKLWAALPPGRYTLRLRDTTTTHMQSALAPRMAPEEEGTEERQVERRERGMCVRFAFNLDVEPSGGTGGTIDLSDVGQGKRFGRMATGEGGTGRGGGVGEARGALVAVDPATALDLDPAQPLRLVFSFSSAIARFGKEGDGTADAGRGGAEGVDEVRCGGGGGGRYWEGSQLCSSVFTLRPASLDMQRGPLARTDQSGDGVKPTMVKLRSGTDRSGPAAAEILVTWSTESLTQGVDYVLHVEQGYLKSVEGGDVSVRAHNGGVHSYRAAACDCHGRGNCDVERRCACAAGYAGDSCQRCAEGRRLSDEGTCEVVKATEVCTRNSCNGHGAVSSSSPLPLSVPTEVPHTPLGAVKLVLACESHAVWLPMRMDA